MAILKNARDGDGARQGIFVDDFGSDRIGERGGGDEEECEQGLESHTDP